MSSLGGNMNYIYGNTLILGDTSYLAHHGILGQKWGIRRFQNKDGSRTAEGKKRYKTMQAAHGTRARGNSPFDRAKNRAIDKAKDEFNELLDNVRYGKNKAKYDAAVDEWDKAQTHRYDEYEKEFDKYASIAGMANAYRCGWDQPNAGFGSRDNMLEFATEFYKYDDGDQGKFNSYDYFLVSKGENPNDVQNKAFKASSAMWELAKEDAKDLFGDLADKKDGPGSTVATSFASSMFNYATAASPITMVDESSGLRYTDQEIKQMQEDIRKFSVEAKRLGTYEEPKHAEKEQRAYDDASKRVFDAVDKADQALQDRFKETDLGKKNPKAIPHIDEYTTGDISSLFSKSTEKQIYDWIRKQDDLREPIREAEEIRSKAESKLRKKVEHTSMGGNMNYIYGNTLILGDTSYLEHHGIKNQKWGIRRFQNPDGSLTAAGRIRYGVTGAAKAAFKVGKKLGAATASAARAGVKKSKENAYAKKKEKASQTREGVLKNKKTFTNEELKRLEERFKIEDDMRNAGLRHGQEIAKTISAYSDAAVKTMNALQTGGKAVKAISDGLSALQDYKEKRKLNHSAFLEHYGTKGQRWGVRRYQNPDGTRTALGKDRYGSKSNNSVGGGGGSPEEDDETIADILGIDVDAYRQKINEGPFGYGQYADQLGEKAEKLHAQADANRKMADQVGLTGNKKKAAEFRKKAESLEKEAVRADKLQQYMNRRANGESALGITADTVNTTIVKPITGLANDIGRNISASNPMNSDLVRKMRRVRHGSMDSFMIENGVLSYGFDKSDELKHFGVRGMKWGVRRFQNADGSLTDKGRKHYQKKLALEERKLTAANAARGRYERVRTPLSVGMGVIGAVAGAMAGVPAGPAGIAAGAAFVSSIAASSTYAEYTLKGVFAGHGANRSKKKIAKYKEALTQDAFEIQNGVLIYGSGQSGGRYDALKAKRKKKSASHAAFIEDGTLYLEHHGIKGQRWGVRRFQNPDGTRTEAGKKRDAKIAAKAAKYRNKDISRYDVEIAKAKDPDQKYRYEQLRKHTEKLSDREIIAQQRYSRAVATGEGIVAAVGVSLGLGMPNIGSIAIGAAVARSIAKTTRDNYRVRSINAERTQESVRREYEDLINHDAFIEDGTLYLAHHGILGQKWGVRRFQDVAGRLTAAGKQHIQEAKKKLGNAGAKYKTSSVETQQTDVVPGGGAAEDWDDFDDESLNYYMDYLLSLSDDQLSALGLKRSDLKKATSRDDKYKIVLALKKIDSTSPKVVRVLNSMLTALFSSDLTKTLEPAKLTGDVLFAKMREHAAAKRRESEEIDPKTGFHIKSDRNSSMETDVRNVNPGFTNLSDNTKNNCMLCTTAYDLRRRGYDVNAERISSGLQTTDVKRYYPDAEVRQVTGATTTAELNQKTKEALISQGEGARGNLMVTWQGGAGGHSMAYEVHNGEVKIYDGQSGEVHETEEIIAYTTAVSYARLDNVEPDWDRIKEAVR